MRISLLLPFLLLFSNLFAQSSEEITLLFMGDIMQHGYQLKAAKTDSGYNYHPNYRYARHIIRDADVAIGNLELTLSGSNYSGYPSFSAPDELALALKDAGFDFLVTANNHSLDRRKQGLERTIDVLDRLQIPHTGTFKTPESKSQGHPAFFEKNGFKLAILNYTYGTNGIPVTEPNVVNLLDKEQIRKDIHTAKKASPDIVIVFTHWGFEYNSLPNQEQKDIAALCLAEGVDLVIGSHPHVLQPIERIANKNGKDQLVAYSLGNYISNQRKRYTDGGMSLQVSFKKDSSGTKMTDAGYYLSWIYPSPSENGQFYILPATMFEYNHKIIKEQANVEKMELYLSDSRNLFSKYNKNIKEYRVFPLLEGSAPDFRPDTTFKISKPIKSGTPKTNKITRPTTKNPIKEIKVPLPVYRIQIFVSSGKMDEDILPQSWKDRLIVVKVGDVNKYQLGDWKTREDAEIFLKEVRSNEQYKDAFILTIK